MLFFHGREAYRRNSFIIGYSFYKNVLYVMTQYYFGFNSLFSGQTLYDPFIYQLYNITMTSLPIMWFGLFDFEFFKDRFMNNPSLYKLGIDSKCFSIKIFIGYLFYAIFHGLIIYLICMICLLQPNNSFTPDGKEFSFWESGHLVYGVCVIAANFLILTRTHNFTGYGEAIVVLMIFAYFFFMFTQSEIGSIKF